ncbi:MAG TPA: Mur ligase family protein [Thermomicrobiales bacterium]|nr:Mur ligase family protein [Thermomicrobiales bacterium]
MIVTDPASTVTSPSSLLYPSFRSWQRDVHAAGLLPVIGISGTRGKSTVLRLLEAMLMASHLRTATWTDEGVEVRGRRQRGELSGWTNALMRLAEMSVDVALQELDWATVNAVGLPPSSYPVGAIVGLREHLDSPVQSPSLAGSIRAAQRVADAVYPGGFIVANADDYYTIDAVADVDATVILVAQSQDSPALRRHLHEGGSAVWVSNGTILVGDADHHTRLCRVTDVPLTIAGEAAFNVTNVLVAVALARSIGIDLPCIARTLREFVPTWEILPGSLNVYEGDSFRAVVDQLGPAWVLRSVLKAINPMLARRQVTVVGDLRWIAPEDVQEVGRLLGRYHGAIVLHSEQDEDLVQSFRRGLASNEFPPLFIYLPTERRAINRALKTLKSDDVLLILTAGDSGPANRAIRRHIA